MFSTEAGVMAATMASPPANASRTSTMPPASSSAATVPTNWLRALVRTDIRRIRVRSESGWSAAWLLPAGVTASWFRMSCCELSMAR